jgi:hypothetical protein
VISRRTHIPTHLIVSPIAGLVVAAEWNRSVGQAYFGDHQAGVRFGQLSQELVEKIPKAASQILFWKLCFGRRGSRKGATITLVIAGSFRNGGVSFLQRVVSRRIVRLRAIRRAAATFRAYRSSPQATLNLGEELS